MFSYLTKLHTLKMIVVIFTLVSAIIGAFIQEDSRYVHQEESDKYRDRTSNLIVAQTIYARRKIVEDRLFELDGKKASNIMTVFENAEYQRLVRELHDLETVKAADILAKLDKTIESLKK